MRTYITLILCILLVSCTRFSNKEEAVHKEDMIYVFRITYGEYVYDTVSAITLEHGEVYYYPNDSLLMDYKIISDKTRIKIDDSKLADLLKSLMNKDLETLSKIEDCKCSGITKNEYVIRIKSNAEVKEFVFPELLRCDEQSPLAFLGWLRSVFTKFRQTDISDSTPKRELGNTSD